MQKWDGTHELREAEILDLLPRVGTYDDIYYPDCGLKSLAAEMLERAFQDARAFGKGEPLSHQAQGVWSQKTYQRKREEFLDWIWCDRFFLWMEALRLPKSTYELCLRLEALVYGEE